MLASFCVQQGYAGHGRDSHSCPHLPSPPPQSKAHKLEEEESSEESYGHFCLCFVKASLQAFTEYWSSWLLSREMQLILLHGWEDWIKKKLIELSKTTQQDSDKDEESLIHSSVCSLKVVLRSDKSEKHAFGYCMKYVFTHLPKLAQIRVVPHICKWPWLFPSVLVLSMQRLQYLLRLLCRAWARAQRAAESSFYIAVKFEAEGLGWWSKSSRWKEHAAVMVGCVFSGLLQLFLTALSHCCSE